jgi:hypothetical protein
MVDSADVAELLRVYWLELGGVLLAVGGGAVAVQRGDLLGGVLGGVLLFVLVDRIRIRMDNRSLTRVLKEHRARDRMDAGADERQPAEAVAANTE